MKRTCTWRRKAARLSGGSLVAAVSLCLLPIAMGQTISFQDGVSPTGAYTMGATYVYSGEGGIVNQNLSGSNSLAVARNDNFFGEAHSLLEFNLAAIPANVQIDSASLVLYNRGTNDGFTGEGNSITVFVRELSNDFDETVATWNNLTPNGGDTSGTQLSQLTFDPTPGANGVDVTFASSPEFVAAVESSLAATDETLRLILLQDPADVGTGFARFYNEEAGSPLDLRPELIVQFTQLQQVPEPSSVLIWSLVGLAFLVCRARRRAKGQSACG